MRYITYNDKSKYPIAILTKPQQLRKPDILQHYITPTGIPSDKFIAMDLQFNGKKAPVKLCRECLDEVLPELCNLRVEYVLVCDSAYFKVLTKQTKADAHYGYSLPCALPGYEHLNIILCPNYASLFYDPAMQAKIDLALNALVTKYQGTYTDLGKDIIHSAYYPRKPEDIRIWLESLHQYPILSCDIEGFSLKFYKCGIGSIGFAWDEHNGGAFAVDYTNNPIEADLIRSYLRDFFESYKGTLIWHNASFDLTVLIYQLWMKGFLDQLGLLKGLDIMCNKFHDTKIISYLATNSCAGNELGLKAQAHEFAGNYAEDDINDITKIPIDELLEYNLVDCLSTWYVANKHSHTMVLDNQLDIYETLMLPSIKNVIQMQLTGMPLDMEEVLKVEQVMLAEREVFITAIKQNQSVLKLVDMLRAEHIADRNSKLKTKRICETDAEVLAIEFNPNSNPQMQTLVYDILKLPVIDLTDSKQPATGADTLKKLINHTSDVDAKELLDNLIKFSKVEKIITSFIPAFKEAPMAEDGHHYLFGSFNLGGTVSGRLSSSGPNLQQIPSSKSPYAKPIKKCFKAPKGWLFIGLDFNALEARIDALTTKDPAKLLVYTDGYDSHSYNAYGYWPHKMPDIRFLDESDTRRTFKITLDGQEHLLIEGDDVELADGSLVKVETLCEQLQKC